MATFLKRIFLVVFVFSILDVSAQIYGPEQIPAGDFGTVTTAGKNGDGLVSPDSILYPTIAGIGTTIRNYYQPVDRVYHNGNLVYLNVNPGVTVGKPLDGKTSYHFGFTEPWENEPYYFPTVSDQNSNIAIPHAPNNGNYAVVTSTKGMYGLPTLNAHEWYHIFDKYETDTLNPVNYFLVTNADSDPTKIFYKEQVNITSGQAYRMSVDIARLNINGFAPNVTFVIDSDEDNLVSAPPAYTTGAIPTQNGAWTNYHFDYVAPCGSDPTTYVAFRNLVAGGNGNDLALDNLSMKAIIPQIQAKINDCDQVSFVMLDNSITNAFDPAIYRFRWQALNGAVYDTIPGATTIQHPITEAGTYRLAVFTDATKDCPMFSNAIKVIRPDNGCLEVANPNAVDDYYTIAPATLLEVDVMINDETSEPSVVPSSALSVTNFVIGTKSYAAGTSGVVYDSDGVTPAGVISIQSDGTMQFQSKPYYVGTIPNIKYFIREEGAGQDSAYIHINMADYVINIDASCISCPVVVGIKESDISDEHDYYIYDKDVLISTGEVIGDSLTFTFFAPRSGLRYYSFWVDNSVRVSNYPIYVAPGAATWAPNTVINSNYWNKSENWKTEDGEGYPIWCTDVTIPGDAAYYPTIENVISQARDITFKSGATVGRIHLLKYRKAFVEMTPFRENWMMLSAPLKYTYSADFQADPTWGTTAAIDPKIYMRYFDVQYNDTDNSKENPDNVKGVSVGNFSRAFADLKERLGLGFGYVIKVDQGSNDAFDGTFKFPRLNADSTEVLFKYHYRSTGNWVETSTNPDYMPFKFTDPGQPGRGTQAPETDQEWLDLNKADYFYNPRGRDNQYRFVYENGSTVTPFNVRVANAGTTDIIGNPFMSHINFQKLYEDNVGVIRPYYRIWDGTSFYSFVLAGNDDDGAWEGLPPVSTSPKAGTPYIAPMQAFFVEMEDGQDEITFNPDSISVAIASPDSRLKSAAKVNNLLTLRLKMNETENIAIVAALPLASDDYNAKEDVVKLFSFDDATPEIYTVSDGQTIEINALGNEGEEKIVPVGIKTNQKGKIEITVEGANSFDAYPYVYLTDVLDNKTYDLKNMSTLTFDKSTSANIEGRFYLVLKGSGSSIGETDADKNAITVTAYDGEVEVSSPLKAIQDIKLYDLSGRLQYAKEGIDSMYYKFSPTVVPGVFILKVSTDTGEKSFKIKF